MSVFDQVDFDEHEEVVFCSDATSGFKAIIAVHSTAIGPALGGTRMRSYANAGEAMKDALRLSRAMSLKNALGDRPFGGGKSVILGDASVAKTDALLASFGEAVGRLGGRYVTAEDAGIGPEDMAKIGKSTRYVRNIAPERGGPAPYTAYGMFVAINSVVERVLKRDLDGVSVSVQGLGGVGMDLCKQLHARGVRLVVSDIDQERCKYAVETMGAALTGPDQAHAAAVDLFAPCAFGGVLNARTIPEIKASIVAGAANNQLAEPEDGKRLIDRGIIYCPDYVINAGGIRSTASSDEQFDHEVAMRRVEGIAETLALILQLSDESGHPTNEVADELAWQRIQRAKEHRWTKLLKSAKA